MKIGIIAGELSGDILGAGLLSVLRESHPSLEAVGVGGPLMMQQGFRSLYDIEGLSVMGFVDPLLRLPELLKMRHGLIDHFKKNPPDVFIGIDAPDFNLGIERELHDAGIPTVHYVSPSVWAWRKRRIHKIKKCVDLMLTLLPFEADFYRTHQVPVQFVGHPLADSIPFEPDQSAARDRLGLGNNRTYIAILPGSRKKELQYLAETFILAAQKMLQEKPAIQFITSSANAARDADMRTACARLAPLLPIHFFMNQTHDVLAASNLVLATSGTVTLEAMLFKRPMVIAYRMAAFNYWIAKKLVKIPFIGLPNLLENTLLIPEFIQDAATPEALSAALMDFLDHPEKIDALQKTFLSWHQTLRCNANKTAAKAVLHLLERYAQ